MGTVTGSEILAKAMKSQGIDTMFYIMGGPMLETESACINLGIRAIDARHEQAAAMEAHAYARMTRRPGVCMGCSGPGTTNLVTGVANAFVDAAPLVAIGGSSPRVHLGMEAFQEIDQVGVMRPITKWAHRILDAKRIPDLVATAFRQATTGRLGDAEIDAELLRDATDAGTRHATACRAAIPDAEHKAAAWHLLAETADLGFLGVAEASRGFIQPEHASLLAPYAERYFEVLPTIWSSRGEHIRVLLARVLFPYPAASPALVAQIDAFLAVEDRDPGLVRVLIERRDIVQRALRSHALVDPTPS